ncbi:hypothetical protein K505DRAFT_371688 [Melanomma pulvis-pyrius CBS 109.77]|uniref:Mid2 domain-containing protein n=1 Tax=Melanomma pulvis-pyrius CBS 109.77 TaxID=1314802 RepID=A0A6A6XQF7_9PLEO|nr:hypothetical protein K505DRAFT_371688 [Melanomma pulvis-pyrius CBS 109.77]
MCAVPRCSARCALPHHRVDSGLATAELSPIATCALFDQAGHRITLAAYAMLQYSICAFLAPALASAAAFPWALPEPTFVIPAADDWSPAPTAAPGLGAIELFRRAAGDNTCGYISAKEASSLTCNNSDFVCATNTFYGVHGCCDPNGISTCSIPTTCIPSSLMSASCTDAACSTNSYIAKCTNSDAPSCYEWRYVYSTRTVMTEHGCASSGWTISVQRTFSDGTTSSSLPSEAAVSSDSSSSEASSATDASSTTDATTTSDSAANVQSATASPSTSGGSAAPTTSKKSNVGPIVGGVVGGLAVLGALAFAVVFLILRNRKAKQNAANAATGVSQPMMGGQGPAPGVTEYKPQPGGYPSPGQQFPPTPGQQYGSPAPGGYPPTAAGYYGQENKAWQQQQGVPGQEVGQQPYSNPGSPAPQYSGPSATQPVPFGAVEAGGNPVPGHPQQQPPQPHPVYEAP